MFGLRKRIAALERQVRNKMKPVAPEYYNFNVYCKHGDKFKVEADWKVHCYSGPNHEFKHLAVPAQILVPFKDGEFYIEASWDADAKRYQFKECPHTRAKKKEKS